ncbi:predicted protein [Chaetoceros tenuissimus]|uniref:Uncharacterized protein n=1 Tax=Chaetoceros tenuissimus TaxID=426638 RepID=A0AAD3CNF5_9STRA|nr:predicted protein [Chaetoceros tenuissimus]
MFINSKPNRRRISSTESSKTASDSKMQKASPMKIETFSSFSRNIDEYNEKTASRYYDAKTWEMYHRIVTSRRRGSFNEQVGNRNDSKKQGILKKRQDDTTDCSEVNQHEIPSEAIFDLEL